MTNHVHQLVTPKQAESIPRLSIALGRRYMQYISTTYCGVVMLNAENNVNLAPLIMPLIHRNVQRELGFFEEALHGDYFAGPLSLADFTLYPMLALIKRVHDKQPQHVAVTLLGPRLVAFMQRIEQLPYFTKTFPPHWIK